MLRKNFGRSLITGLKVVWPVLSFLLGIIVGNGLVIGWLEGWPIEVSIYFSFTTALTIGYGDFTPKTFVTRFLAMIIGLCGMLSTSLVAAVAVKALTITVYNKKE